MKAQKPLELEELDLALFLIHNGVLLHKGLLI